MALNAPGEVPSAERVEAVTRQALDRPNTPTPAVCTTRMTAFLTDNPGDDNFLLELPDKDDATKGGNGFGTITCMEDMCWEDILLTADPELADGGRSEGLGSMYEFAVHCRTTKHIDSRDGRLLRKGVQIPTKVANVAVLPEDIVHDRGAASAASSTYGLPGPSSSNSNPYVAVNARGTSSFTLPSAGTPNATAVGPSWALNSSTHTTSSASRPSSVLSEHSLNAPDVLMGSPDVKPRITDKGKAKEVIMESDDDEIVFVKSIQGRRAPKAPKAERLAAQKSSIIVIDSDDDEDENTRPRTPKTQPRSSVPNTPSASQRPAHVVRWTEMTIHERMAAVTHEIEALSKIRQIRPEDRTVLQMRRSDLKGIKSSFGIRQWTPPPQTVLRLITRAAIHPRLVDTILWPMIVAPPVVPKPEPDPLMPGAFPGSVAGPSTQLWPANAVAGPSTYTPGAGSTIHLGAALTPVSAGPAQWNAAWDQIPIAHRKGYSAAEVGLLGAAYKKCKHHATKMEILSRHALAIQRCNHPAISKWTPMSASLLANYATLRTVTHPDLHKFLPPVGTFGGLGLSPVKAPGDDLDAEDYGFGYERDRPQSAAELSTFFQDALQDFKEDATVEDGLKKLNLNSLADQMPGANFTLLAHQVLGVAFMVAREERKSGSRGGLLCDAMGLGKTVQCLGLMLQRNTRPDDFKKAPQLIVAPVALLEQWKSEIETKTTVGFKVFIHHGSNKLKSVNAMKKYDIILTSYGTLRAEAFPRGMKKKKKKRGAQPNAGAESSSDSDLGRRTSVLLRIKWFRVILDEAHNARNKKTATAQSILKLDFLHPWYLSGTPIVNTLGDLGPALNFIGAMADEDFHKRVVKMEKRKPRLAAKRMQAILKPLVMRRNKESEINGQKILTLPPKTTNMPQLPFQPEERAIYSAIEQRAKVQVNKFIREGTLMKNYQVILVLLLRLRQCVNHPWLLRRKPGEAARDDDLLVDGDAFGASLCQTRPDDSDEYGRAIALIGQDDVNNLVKKLEERHLAMTAEDGDREDSPDMECSICYEPFDGQELITKCGHVYCKGCLDNLFGQPLRDETTMTDEEVQRGCRVCPMCRAVLERGHTFRAAELFQPEVDAPEAIDDDEREDDGITPDVDHKGKGRADGKGKKRAVRSGADLFKKKRKLEDGEAEEVELDDVDLDAIEENQIPPSSKMRHLLELVQGYLEEDPTTKILVFSQFVQFLDLLSDFLNVHGIRNIGYRGAMGPNERSEAIRRFSMPSAIADSISVMLISTKAGGVGLNLTMANKVICCDLAWNPATENQAVDRAHRIGQTKPVQVERLVIADTVEDRLLKIQEEKGLLADGAMGEGEVGKIGRLTVEHIRTLFGIDREHELEDN